MSCMKCGKEVSEGQVFCQECLEEMEKYPVKPGTAVLLPNRPHQAVVHKRSYRKSRKPEDQISRLRKWNVALCVICCVVMVALILSLLLNLKLMGDQDIHALLGQQNISASQTDPNR